MKRINEVIHPTKRDLKVIQFGEGNFLRAFVQWIFQIGNEKEIINANFTVIQPLPQGRVKELEDQNGLYTLYLEGIQEGKVIQEIKQIDVLEKFINPYTEYQAYLDLAKEDSYEFIVSNTTEAGITFDENDKDYNQTPTSFPGKLLALLIERYKYTQGDLNRGYIILPCELIDYNGAKLKEVLNELAIYWNLENPFIEWLNQANEFCSTLVDRIVPGYPRNQIKEIEEQLGYTDHSIVKGEIFHLWVIEGSQKVQAKLPFDQVGLNVVYTNDLTPYKQRKVRVLNGAHTALVPVAYLYGFDTVKESVEDQVVGSFLNQVIFEEIIPASTHFLSKEELSQFAADVISRFKNPYIRHELMSIALNGTTKFKTRLLPSMLDYIEKQKSLPKHLCFSLASTLVLYRGKRGEANYTIMDDDKFIQLYNQLWGQFDGSKEAIDSMVKTYLGLVSHWEVDLNTIDGFNQLVSHYVERILTVGMNQALEELMM